MNFIEQLVQGTASTSEIYDRIDFWKTHETGDSLQYFLGLTENEMKLLFFNDNDGILDDIVYCRKNNIDVVSYVNEKGK